MEKISEEECLFKFREEIKKLEKGRLRMNQKLIVKT